MDTVGRKVFCVGAFCAARVSTIIRFGGRPEGRPSMIIGV